MTERSNLKEELQEKGVALGAKAVACLRAESLADSGALYTNMMIILPEARSVISFFVPFPSLYCDEKLLFWRMQSSR